MAVVFAVALFISHDVSASSNPIPGVGIVVKRNPGSSTARTKTDKDGKFEVSKLEPGSYTLEVVTDDITKAMEKMERKNIRASSTGKKGDKSDGLSASTDRALGVAAGAAASPVPQISITEGSVIAKDGSIKTYSWTQLEGPLTITVGEDGTISGQLRASTASR